MAAIRRTRMVPDIALEADGLLAAGAALPRPLQRDGRSSTQRWADGQKESGRVDA